MMSPSPEEREAPEFVRRASVALSGVYAWATTVLYPISLRGASWGARIAGSLALVALVAGVALGARRARLGRGLALHAFVTLSLVAWVMLGSLVAVDRLEPVKAALGVVGWVLFAFGWGAPREVSRVPEDDPRVLPGDPLRPRGELPRGALPVLAVAVAGAALPLLLAWRVTRSYHALFAHAVGLIAAIALVTAGAEVAVRRGRWAAVEPPARRLQVATLPLAALAVVLFVGLVELLTS